MVQYEPATVLGNNASSMLGFSQFARREGAQVVSVDFFGWSAVTDQLRRAGMVLRPGGLSLFVGSRTEAEFRSPESWYVTDFDNDAD